MSGLSSCITPSRYNKLCLLIEFLFVMKRYKQQFQSGIFFGQFIFPASLMFERRIKSTIVLFAGPGQLVLCDGVYPGWGSHVPPH